MRGATHLIGGLAAALVAERLAGQPTALREVFYLGEFPVSQMLVGAAVAAFGALLPDIDEPHSTVANLPRHAERIARGRSNDPLDVAIRTTVKGGTSILNILTQTFSTFIRALGGGHRGATHWLLIALLLSGAMFWLAPAVGLPKLGLWFAAGYFSHLLLDMLTTNGLRILSPFYNRTIYLLPKKLRVRTGSWLEQGVRAWLLVLVVWMVWK